MMRSVKADTKLSCVFLDFIFEIIWADIPHEMKPPIAMEHRIQWHLYGLPPRLNHVFMRAVVAVILVI